MFCHKNSYINTDNCAKFYQKISIMGLLGRGQGCKFLDRKNAMVQSNYRPNNCDVVPLETDG